MIRPFPFRPVADLHSRAQDVNKEIELDIDQLDQRTLLALYRFVCPSNVGRKPKNASRRSNGGGSAGQQPGPSKRKNLDEMKESERIEMLEARLREFDQSQSQQQQPQSAPDSRRDSGVPLPEDQASSDSSSESESSDSDEE